MLWEAGSKDMLLFSFEVGRTVRDCLFVRGVLVSGCVPVRESSCIIPKLLTPGGKPFHILGFLYPADSVLTMLIVIYLFCI